MWPAGELRKTKYSIAYYVAMLEQKAVNMLLFYAMVLMQIILKKPNLYTFIIYVKTYRTIEIKKN